MATTTATQARKDLYHLIDQVNSEARPVTITGVRGNAVLLAERDYQALQESLYLSSIPGLAESIRQARGEGLDEGSERLEW